ncbi:MAG: TonB-dependent receptor [Rubrivivax sp.]|jgi:iron complex outermembrane receptor protein
MNLRLTPIATAAALTLWGLQGAALAQTAAPAAPAAKPAAPAVIEVTGIRAAIEQSLNTKRNSDALVEVVSAEDIGKMPDKNVADSLQRVAGVTISTAGAGEGGFDENDRVSLRGTNPSLTRTMVNGHSLASGEWFVLNQVGTVGRSVSYSLLPADIVKQVIVRKGSTADLVEGGVAGSVDIITRKPLELKKQLTLEGRVGLEYSDLPGTTDPQLSGFLGWKNTDNTVGVLVQAFSEKRRLRRDGMETLGYSAIAPGSKIALSNPDLAGVLYPNVVGAALFEQERHRTGGLIDVQIKPMAGLTLDFNAFTSHMKATNYNRNYMIWNSKILNGGEGQAPDAGYKVKDGTLVSASFANLGTGGPDDTANRRQYVIVDQIYRPGAFSETNWFSFAPNWRVNDKLTLSAQVGTSKGKGETPEQAVFEADVFNTGAYYNLKGTSGPADAGLKTGSVSNFGGARLDWVFGASPAKSIDKETWLHLDGEYAIDAAGITTVKFGLRNAKHSRQATWVAQGPNWAADPFNVANLPAWNGNTYPGDFGAGLGGSIYGSAPWMLDANVLEAWGDKYSNRDPKSRQYFPGEFELEEKNTAAYAMANLEGKGWSGNVGLRLVRVEGEVLNNVAIPGSVCAVQAPCSVPGAITTSAFGSFYRKPTNTTHTEALPSANFKFDLAKGLVGRLGLARTMAMPDFSALGGAVSLDDTNKTGNGGNPNLKPIVSTNVDATVEWYFQPRAVLQAGLFHMDLKNYIDFGVSQAVYFNEQSKKFETYNITSPVNSSGKVTGFELAWQQPLFGGFGANANYTYADAKNATGGPLVGASKNSYTMGAYYEDDRFNVRLNYTHRSTFYNGLDRSSAQYQVGVGSLAASLGYKINDNLSITLDGMNLNNPVLKYYAANESQPTAFYNNGRQYYLSLRGKL